MNRLLDLRLVFLGLFAVTLVGLFAWESINVWPQKACEKRGGHWWAPRFHACARVVSIPMLTGRSPKTGAAKPGPAAPPKP
jgi:hypothetical protein